MSLSRMRCHIFSHAGFRNNSSALVCSTAVCCTWMKTFVALQTKWSVAHWSIDSPICSNPRVQLQFITKHFDKTGPWIWSWSTHGSPDDGIVAHFWWTFYSHSPWSASWQQRSPLGCSDAPHPDCRCTEGRRNRTGLLVGKQLLVD